MTTLETYKNDPNILLTTIGPDADKCLAPGRWVSQGSGDDVLGFGMVVAVTADEIAVLWSVAPWPRLLNNEIIGFQQKLFAALKVPPEYLGYEAKQ